MFDLPFDTSLEKNGPPKVPESPLKADELMIPSCNSRFSRIRLMDFRSGQPRHNVSKLLAKRKRALAHLAPHGNDLFGEPFGWF